MDFKKPQKTVIKLPWSSFILTNGRILHKIGKQHANYGQIFQNRILFFGRHFADLVEFTPNSTTGMG